MKEICLCTCCILGSVSSKATSCPRQRCPNARLSAGSNVLFKEHSDLFLHSLQNLDPPMDPEDAPWPSGFEPPAAPQVRYAVLQVRTILARVKLATGTQSTVLMSQQHGMQRCCWFCACLPAGRTSAPGLDSKARNTFAKHPHCEALRPLLATMKAFQSSMHLVGRAGRIRLVYPDIHIRVMALCAQRAAQVSGIGAAPAVPAAYASSFLEDAPWPSGFAAPGAQ